MEKIEILTQETNNFISAWKIDNLNLMDQIIEFFEENPELHNDGIQGFDKANKNYKDTTDISIQPNKLNDEKFQIFRAYISHIHECYQNYRKDWDFFGGTQNKINVGSFNLQKYEIGGHVNAWHTERDSIFSSHRVLAWITYLNDVNEDGETEFYYYNLKVKPEKGKTLIWPAEWTHAHRGLPTLNSEKYVITGWLHFPEEN